MTAEPPSSDSGPASTDWIAPGLALIPLFLALRVYEWLIVGHEFPGASAPFALFGAAGHDAIAAIVAAVAVALVYGLSRFGGRVAARRTATVFGLLLVMGHVALIQYFATTRVLLGADLYGYSLMEIFRTAGTSATLGWVQVLAYPAFAMAYLLLVQYLWNSWPTVLGLTAASVIVILLGSAASTRQDPEAGSGWQPNKLAAWAGATAGFIFDRVQDRQRAAVFEPDQEYPLLHETDYPDVLGPLLRQTERPPNLVVITIEGLGEAFMPGSRYGGFTPFLGELARTGLYWQNMVAGSGRSFGFMPTFFGSLPYGRSGFMSLGFHMPVHDTLISLLNDNGYHTGFFCGFNSQFDNQAVFLERQGIDLLMDEGAFGADYERVEPDQQGFSWGYPDAALYRRAAEALADLPVTVPRLDMYHTLNMHEPFIVPEPERYAALFEKRLAERDPPPDLHAEIRRHSDLFTALTYTDESLRVLFEKYRQREDFERTVFIITGDHHSIPIPHRSAIDRFHVPLIVWSPLVKKPRRFPAVSTHADVTPSLLAYLQANYGLTMPERVHWIGRGLDVAADFRSQRRLPIMRVKNDRSHYLDGEYFLANGALYRVRPGLALEPMHQPSTRRELQADLEQFNTINDYVIAQDRLRPPADIAAQQRISAEISEEEALLEELGLQEANPEQLFERARSDAIAGNHEPARTIARRVLRGHPNYHDMRTLLARSHAWQGEYEQAREILAEVHSRAPGYVDAYSARVDMELWDGNPQAALAAAEEGLGHAPGSPHLILQKARALGRLGRFADARELLAPLARENSPVAEAAAKLLQSTPSGS